MKRMFTLVLPLFAVVLVGALVAHAKLAARDVDDAITSHALGGKLHFEVYLPPGYDDKAMRYPVVYFLHGLPAGPGGYRSAGFLEQALERLGRPAIVVAPQGSRQANGDPEYLGGWETALTRELPAAVDVRYRTIRDRRGRALIGISAGGYGAMLLALHHLAQYAVIESWSGYFHPTNPQGTATRDLGSTEANARASAHTYVRTLKRRLAAEPTFIGFYVGDADDRFRDENVQLHRELAGAGVPHVFRLYPGGHDSSVWRTHAPQWLTLALDHLAAPRG